MHRLIGPAPVANMADVTDYLQLPQFYNTWGVMVAATIRGSYKDSSGTIPIYANDASACFLGSDDSFRTSGAVTINGFTLDTTTIQYPYYCKYYYNSGNVLLNALDFTTNNTWAVAGNSHTPPISYNYTGAFPSYTGAIPDTLSENQSIVMYFDASNCSNADSVFIRLSCANEIQRNMYSTVVSANGGSINISSNALEQMLNYITSDPGKVYLEVYLFKYTTQTFGNRKYVFMKINENIHNVYIKP